MTRSPWLRLAALQEVELIYVARGSGLLPEAASGKGEYPFCAVYGFMSKDSYGLGNKWRI
jgi:hypothetical protein